MKLDRMPEFDSRDYASLLEAILEAGYRVRPIAEMPEPVSERTLYLRHDIDFHLHRIDETAELDAAAGIASTFFLLLSGHYNPMLRENRAVIERIVSLGHEVGLHYDLRDYPDDLDAAREQLDFEASLVERITGQPVRSIVMHEPSAGHGDVFTTIDGYVHPHDPRWSEGLAYISDSCRAWRDDRLLRALEPDGPQRLMLLLHGELWLDGSVPDRIDYLAQVTSKSASYFANEYFNGYMARIWCEHEAVRMDAERRAAHGPQGEGSSGDR